MSNMTQTQLTELISETADAAARNYEVDPAPRIVAALVEHDVVKVVAA